MFPTSFADTIVDCLTDVGDRVLDPFAGRATSLYSAASKFRYAGGVEINPVGWVYGKAKLDPAAQKPVEARLLEIVQGSRNLAGRRINELPLFFNKCYSRS